MSAEILVGGRRVPCAVEVTHWHASKLKFDGETRSTSPDLILLAWSGTDEVAAAHHESMRKPRARKSEPPILRTCHLHVDHLGRVHQHMDVLARPQFQGRVNKRAVVIVLSNRADASPRRAGIVRPTVREEINGEHSECTTPTAPQRTACLALIDTLCEALGVPVRVPMAGHDVRARVLPDAELGAFSGVLGMLHVSDRHRDPGLSMLRAVAAHDNPLRTKGPAE